MGKGREGMWNRKREDVGEGIGCVDTTYSLGAILAITCLLGLNYSTHIFSLTIHNKHILRKGRKIIEIRLT